MTTRQRDPEQKKRGPLSSAIMAKLSIRRSTSSDRPNNMQSALEEASSSQPPKRQHSSGTDLTEFSLSERELMNSSQEELLDAGSEPITIQTEEQEEDIGASSDLPEQPPNPSSSPPSPAASRACSECLLPSQLSRLEGESVDFIEKKKRVSFSNIEINHYAIMLGDNPAVSSGPPVALGRKLLHMDSISVVDYEANRPPRREKFQMAFASYGSRGHATRGRLCPIRSPSQRSGSPQDQETTQGQCLHGAVGEATPCFS